MAKYFFPAFFFLALYSCDPVYSLTYVVVNKSNQPAWAMDTCRYSFMDKKKMILNPGDSTTLRRFSGIGFARGEFEGKSKDSILKEVRFYSDSAGTDSTQIFPAGKWKYTEKMRSTGTATLVITAADLEK